MTSKLEFFTKTGPHISSQIANEMFKKKYTGEDLPIYVDMPINPTDFRNTDKLVHSIEEGFERVLSTINDINGKMRVFANFDGYLQVHPRMKSGKHTKSKSHKENTEDHIQLRNDTVHLANQDETQYKDHIDEYYNDLDLLIKWFRHITSIEKGVSDIVNDRTDDRHINYQKIKIQDVKNLVREYYMENDSERFYNKSYVTLINQLEYLSSRDLESIRLFLDKEKGSISRNYGKIEKVMHSKQGNIDKIEEARAQEPEINDFNLSDKLRDAIQNGQFDQEVLNNIERLFIKEKFLVPNGNNQYDDVIEEKEGDEIVNRYNIDKQPSFTYGMLEDKSDKKYSELKARYKSKDSDGSEKFISDIVDSLVKCVSNTKTIKRLLSFYSQKKVNIHHIIEFDKLYRECYDSIHFLSIYNFIFENLLNDVTFSDTTGKHMFTLFYKKLQTSFDMFDQELASVGEKINDMRRNAN